MCGYCVCRWNEIQLSIKVGYWRGTEPAIIWTPVEYASHTATFPTCKQCVTIHTATCPTCDYPLSHMPYVWLSTQPHALREPIHSATCPTCAFLLSHMPYVWLSTPPHALRVPFYSATCLTCSIVWQCPKYGYWNSTRSVREHLLHASMEWYSSFYFTMLLHIFVMLCMYILVIWNITMTLRTHLIFIYNVQHMKDVTSSSFISAFLKRFT